MRIRPAGASDIEAMHTLRCRVTENVLSDRALVTEASYPPFLVGDAAWVAETGKGIAGFAVLDVARGSVWALFVAPEAEGTGIGRALHARLLDGAARHGLTRLLLNTEPQTRAERFYTEAGWIRTGVTKNGELAFERDIAA
jgi:GNAT superfamily N-acetyltransferase